ncbi:MAG: hypothetical protein GY748_15760 [Planctomycetaceae bacterium]|nr:hypothetical protein [Planctomycetaceae bacterium]
MLRNSNKAKLIPACLLALWLVAILGCQNSTPAVTSTANVSGTVTLDGEPVSGAAIVFIPVNLRDDNNEILNLAYGVTNQDGFFQLAYSDNNPDIIGTNYNILITKSNSATPWPLALLPESIAKFSTFNESEELIPENYNVHSELYFDFNDSKENVVKDFKLSTLDPSL